MSKKSASKDELGALHSTLTRVFNRVLEQYMVSMDKLDKALSDEEVEDEIEAEFLKELDLASLQPNPTMLSAVAKFLKDNEIRFSDAEVDKLGSLQGALEERRKNRSNVVELRTLKVVGEE